MVHRAKSAILAVVLVSVGIALGGEAALAYQGHMFTARRDLQAARAQLGVAVPDKAGHRESALGLVNQALAQTNAGIAAGAR